MRFKHSVNLTADLFSEVFKLFLYRLVTGVIFFSLMYLILWLGLTAIMGSAEFSALRGLVGDFLRALAMSLASGNAAALTEFQNSAHAAVLAFADLLSANLGSIIGSVLGVCCVYLLQRIVNGLAQFAIGSTINDRMATCSKTRFSVSYFKNVGKAALYHIVYVPLAFLYDVIGLLFCWFAFFYIPSLLPNHGVISVLVAVGFTVTAVITLQALKLTLISAWMPSMIAGGKSVFGSLRESFRMQGGFARRFGGFFVACYVIVFLNVGFALFTAFGGLLFTIPLSFVFLIVMQFVNYYESAGKKYFLDKNAVWSGDEPSVDP